MDSKQKLTVFQNELNYIRNSKIKEFTSRCVELLPDYFFEIPASSTGKYHPSYTLGAGGLVKHVRAAVRIAVEMCGLDMFKYTDDEKDAIVATLILHDGVKSGINKGMYTAHEHPLLIVEYIKRFPDVCALLDEDILNIIFGALASHMGQWQTARNSRVELPKPKGKLENFVHLCDYLASRKCLEHNFDVSVGR